MKNPGFRFASSGLRLRRERSFRMTGTRELTTAVFTALAVLACLGTKADAAQCGSTAAGFEAWKGEFAGEARAKGIGASTAAALMQANYASATIAADRGQRSFGLSLDQFLAKRGAASGADRSGSPRDYPLLLY
jgi:membrane-bound lytic murein transglycosylase B